MQMPSKHKRSTKAAVIYAFNIEREAAAMHCSSYLYPAWATAKSKSGRQVKLPLW
jgi:hypothetical protein